MPQARVPTALLTIIKHVNTNEHNVPINNDTNNFIFLYKRYDHHLNVYRTVPPPLPQCHNQMNCYKKYYNQRAFENVLERTSHDRVSAKATGIHRESAKVCTSPSSVLPVTYRWKYRIPKDVAEMSIILRLVQIATVSTVDSDCPVTVKRGS